MEVKAELSIALELPSFSCAGHRTSFLIHQSSRCLTWKYEFSSNNGLRLAAVAAIIDLYVM